MVFDRIEDVDYEYEIHFAHKHSLLQNTYDVSTKERLKLRIDQGFVISDFELMKNQV